MASLLALRLLLANVGRANRSNNVKQFALLMAGGGGVCAAFAERNTQRRFCDC
jgi:hypothetical protein